MMGYLPFPSMTGCLHPPLWWAVCLPHYDGLSALSHYDGLSVLPTMMGYLPLTTIVAIILAICPSPLWWAVCPPHYDGLSVTHTPMLGHLPVVFFCLVFWLLVEWVTNTPTENTWFLLPSWSQPGNRGPRSQAVKHIHTTQFTMKLEPGSWSLLCLMWHVQKGSWNRQSLDASFIWWEPEPWLLGTQGCLHCPLEAAGSLKATSLFVPHNGDTYRFTPSLKKNWNSIVMIIYLKNVGFLLG